MRSSRSLRLLATGFALASSAIAWPSRAEVERVNVDALGRNPNFSQATIASGQLVFVAGTLGTVPGTRDLATGGVTAQTKQALENIDRILEAARTNRGNVLSCTVYLTDMAKFGEMNEAWLAFYGDRVPARATIGVQALAIGAAVEVECIAQRTVTTAG
jgi:2-iminobutanoate/2-iminopropanoate deaminase